MVLNSPLPYRDSILTTTCKCCGSKVDMQKTIHPVEYEKLDSYLDGFKKGMENDFFEMRFVGCDKCSNFGTNSLDTEFYKSISGEEIEIVVNSDRSAIEKRFIINYLIHRDVTSLQQLYWYFDFKKQNTTELELCRDALIEKYEEELEENLRNKKETPLSKMELENSIFMLIELYRRKGDFKTVIVRSKDYKSKITSLTKELVKKEIQLAKSNDKDRH